LLSTCESMSSGRRMPVGSGLVAVVVGEAAMLLCLR
jgi:hypothetical protein